MQLSICSPLRSQRPSALRALLRSAFACCAATAICAYAQPNVLGLPAVPQNTGPTTMIVPVPIPAAAASAAKRKAGAGVQPTQTAILQGPQIRDSEAKAVLSGGVTMVSSYTDKIGTVRVTTNTVYAGVPLRRQALNAARLVQRDLALACAWQCKPAAMAAPTLLADGKLQFEMAIDPYPRVLSYDDMVAMLLGKPLAVVPKPGAAGLTVTVVPAAPAAPASASPAAAVPAAPAAQ
jgi:hypothetical protein